MTTETWPDLLNRLVAGENLSAAQTRWAMNQVMSGEATPSQIAALAVGLRAKGETAEEVVGMADGMLANARTFDVPGPAVDIVGTGGDRSGSVNISTMSAIVTAAAGAPVVKHGNRSASSKCGAADVLEALGVVAALEPEAVARCVTELGIGFCFAPVFHPALRFAGPTRRELGIPTIFNLLGPLTNPARPNAGLVGCAYPDKLEVIANVFAARKASALVVRGDDGLDELTTTTTSTVWRVAGENVTVHSFDPRDVGIDRAAAEDLRGGDAEQNAAVVRALVAGETGPVRDAVLLNAGAALAAFSGFGGSLVDDIAAGIERAAEALDSGAAAQLLDRWVALSQSLAGQD
ncbi:MULTISPECIES: anthranilate phosphoribosyltransferase [Thermocrispum]|jgi:anthranilate phosphoribosyltransferase|uniref:Anthranilate phosphoribosyltransferase n=1 Tax=Thermocrispum agreste TaxID=37925 RepID=A0ABD6FC37_9PSEU|nr:MULTISPECIES: anthranilate phosphoribosyltransferase [Thermocrispum]